MPATLQTVVTRVTRDYLNRTDLDAETVRSVKAAIKHYENQRFPWNQTATALVASVSSASLTVPSDFLVLDVLEVRANSATYELTPETFANIRRMNSVNTPTNIPQFYALRGLRFELSPIPASAFTVNCYYLHKLPELTATDMSGTNEWLSACEDVIVYHATKLMWANVLRNTEEATKYATLESQAWTQVIEARDQQLTGSISPTSF